MILNQSIPSQMNQSYYNKTLFKRRKMPSSSQLGCVYLLQTLKSYPDMMLSDTLPPFIHRTHNGMGSQNNSPTSPTQKNRISEPLAICKSIMQIYATRTWESNNFLWRTIEMEQSRLREEVCIQGHQFD